MTARGILGDARDLKVSPRPFGYKPEVSPPFDSAHPVFKAIEEKRRRLEFEHTRVLLGEPLNVILYDDIVFETNRAFCSEETRATYRSDFNKFQEWCRENKLSSLPTSPEIVAHFLIEMALEHPPERLGRIVGAIAYTHEWSDLPWRDDVVVKAALRWAKRCYEQEAAKRAEQPTDAVIENTKEPSLHGSGGAH
jgi:hypothetical protein